MPSCPACGADLFPPYRFCGRCGASVPTPPLYPIYPAAVPPKKNNVVMIIVIVLVVFIAGSMAASAILYIMVSGLIRPSPGLTSKPVMTLAISTQSSLSATVLVTGIAPAVSPSNFKANIQVNTTYGTAVSLPTVSGGVATLSVPSVGTFLLTWQDADGDGLVSGGDRFQLTNRVAIAAGTTMTLLFIWTDGSIVSAITWQV